MTTHLLIQLFDNGDQLRQILKLMLLLIDLFVMLRFFVLIYILAIIVYSMGPSCVYRLQFLTGDQQTKSRSTSLTDLQEDLPQIKVHPYSPSTDSIDIFCGERDKGQFLTFEPPLNETVRQIVDQKGSIKKQCCSYNRSKNVYDQPKSYFKFERTGIVYAGSWENGKIQDFGINFYPSGAYYEGTFVQGIPHGYGLFINPNGDYYEGEVRYGLASGQGFYKTKEVSIFGQFKDNYLHGQVQQKSDIYYFRGKYQCGIRKAGLLKYKETIYEGEFMQDLFEGEAVLSSTQGRFEGHFHKGFQQGYGQFQWKDKNRYSGDYKNGRRSGYGEYSNFKDQTICRGMWDEGVLEGNGQYRDSSKKTHKVIWRQGKIAKLC